MAELLGDRLEVLLLLGGTELARVPTEQSLDHLLAVRQGLVSALLGEPLLDLRLGTTGSGEAQPIPAGAGIRCLGGEDLDDVPGLEAGGERDQAAVHLGSDASVADLGVDGVGEVDRCCPRRQRLGVTPRGEHYHLILIEVEFEVGQELLRILVGSPGGDIHVGDPAHVAFLVSPMGGNPRFGSLMHLLGANLHLQGLAA